MRGKLQCNRWNKTNCIAYHTSHKRSCLQGINSNWDSGLAGIGPKWYPMEPIESGRQPLYWISVQKMRLEQSPASGEIRVQAPSWRAHFLVIAAPRPSGLPDLEFIQASVTEGRFFVLLRRPIPHRFAPARRRAWRRILQDEKPSGLPEHRYIGRHCAASPLPGSRFISGFPNLK